MLIFEVTNDEMIAETPQWIFSAVTEGQLLSWPTDEYKRAMVGAVAVIFPACRVMEDLNNLAAQGNASVIAWVSLIFCL